MLSGAPSGPAPGYDAHGDKAACLLGGALCVEFSDVVGTYVVCMYAQEESP